MAAVGAAYAAATATQVAMWAATAVAVAASVQQTVQANANANAQEDAARIRNESLVEQTVANYDELADVELDRQQSSIDETLSVQEGYIQEKGRINVMAAAMGTGGLSVKSQLTDLERDKYSNYNTILLSRQADMDNLRSQAETMRYQAANSMDVSPISRPSYAAAALNIGSQVLSTYTATSSPEMRTQANQLSTSNVSSGG